MRTGQATGAWRPSSHISPRHLGIIASWHLGALVDRDFVKMNGLGNEIVIVDLRRTPAAVSAAEARAAARQ